MFCPFSDEISFTNQMTCFLMFLFNLTAGAVKVNWSLVFGSAAFDMVYNTSLAWGLAVSSPVFVSLGANVGTPAAWYLKSGKVW